MCMHRGICDNSAAVFGKYIVFSKAEISNASDEWRSFSVWGEGLAAVLGMDKHGLGGVCEQHGAWWVQTDGAGERFECHVPTESAAALTELLAGKFQPGEETAWQLAEINAGIGHREPETVEMFIPQMLNYQLTGHVSFNKGCYTGQEVVARMHYRGKLKRPMYLASIAIDPDPAGTPAAAKPEGRTSERRIAAAGTPLYKPGSEQSIGNVVNCSADGDAYRLLAVVTSAAIEAGVHLGEPRGPGLSFHDLPYPLPSD